jgi:hypothetical protein
MKLMKENINLIKSQEKDYKLTKTMINIKDIFLKEKKKERELIFIKMVINILVNIL